LHGLCLFSKRGKTTGVSVSEEKLLAKSTVRRAGAGPGFDRILAKAGTGKTNSRPSEATGSLDRAS
jgi:hypothetical protein